ncbi:MAG: hypothetical protein K0Q65_520 [Clostridia bacterium]|nr:hypothetical protein [Clostridia bacterium]
MSNPKRKNNLFNYVLNRGSILLSIKSVSFYQEHFSILPSIMYKFYCLNAVIIKIRENDQIQSYELEERGEKKMRIGEFAQKHGIT